MAKHNGRIWRPTQEEEFLAAFGRERQEEGVFIYPNRWHYPGLRGISAVRIVSRGKAEVFLRQGPNEICLIRRDSPKQAGPGVIGVPSGGLGLKEEARIIFRELGETANIFLRVDGKFSAEAKIELQEK